MRKTIDLLMHRFEDDYPKSRKTSALDLDIELIGDEAAKSVRGGDRESQPMIYSSDEQPGLFQKIRIMDLF